MVERAGLRRALGSIMVVAMAVTGLAATGPEADAAPAAPSWAACWDGVRADGGDPLAGQVWRIYRAALDRDPDPAGMAYWVARRRGGVPMSAVAATFTSASEFRSRYGQPTSTTFVTAVYRNVFDRDPDPAGLSFWTDHLRQGRLTRAQVLTQIAESAEHIARTRTTPPHARCPLPPGRAGEYRPVAVPFAALPAGARPIYDTPDGFQVVWSAVDTGPFTEMIGGRFIPERGAGWVAWWATDSHGRWVGRGSPATRQNQILIRGPASVPTQGPPAFTVTATVTGPTEVTLIGWRVTTSSPPPTSPLLSNRVVHLTFDDGPHSRCTPQVLEVLAQYRAQGTFFVLGGATAARPDLVAMTAQQRHAVANHSWSHPPLSGVSADRLTWEISSTTNVIADVTGRRPTCLRPPYGATNARVAARAAGLGQRIVLWDVDPEDWRGHSASTIASHVISRTRPGAVVLLHDGGGTRASTVAALGTILASLRTQGYRFEPVPGC